MEVDLIIRPTGRYGERGEVYEVLYQHMKIASGVSPEFAACRVLVDRGVTGLARFWREGKITWDFSMPIDWGATHCVVETRKTGPRFGKWSPSPFALKANEALDEPVSDPVIGFA